MRKPLNEQALLFALLFTLSRCLLQKPTLPGQNRKLFNQHFGHYSNQPLFGNQSPSPIPPPNPMMMNPLQMNPIMMLNPALALMNPMMNPMMYPMMNPMSSMNMAEVNSLAGNKLYADDLAILTNSSDMRGGMSDQLNELESRNLNEINEEIAAFKQIKRSELDDFNNFIGEVIAFRPTI